MFICTVIWKIYFLPERKLKSIKHTGTILRQRNKRGAFIEIWVIMHRQCYMLTSGSKFTCRYFHWQMKTIPSILLLRKQACNAMRTAQSVLCVLITGALGICIQLIHEYHVQLEHVLFLSSVQRWCNFGTDTRLCTLLMQQCLLFPHLSTRTCSRTSN